MVGYQQSSTLQRLLTAPERSFQSVSRQGHHNAGGGGGGHSTKVHNNGEITITPIAGTSRKQDFSMVKIIAITILAYCGNNFSLYLG
jgi:hypothetical protein